MGFFSNLSSDMLSTAKKKAAESGTDVVTLANTEQGGIDVQKRDLGNGVNAYIGEDGQISSFTRVDPAKPGMIQLYGPNGEARGETKITTSTQDLITNLGPIALAAGGSYLAQSLLGPAAGNGAFLGEGVASGVPAFDAAFTSAGGTFNPAFGLPVGNGAFLGEGVPTGIPASDAAYLKAGGTFNPAFALGADGLVGTPTAVNALAPPIVTPPVVPPIVTPPVVPPVVTPPVVTPPVVTPPGVIPPIAQIAAPVIAGLVGADAAKSAAETQAQSAREANELLYKMYQEQKGLQEPFRGAGITAQNRLLDLLGLSQNRGAEGFGKYGRDFSMSDFTADPGYAFRLAEGQKTLDRQAAARGGLISGGALKAATRYGQDMGSQEYQNAFNRYQTNRANQLQPLGSLLTSGQAAASNQGAAAGSYGAGASGNITGAGAAQAAGQVGSVNALTNALSGYLNYSSSQNLADAIRKSTYGG